MRLKVQHHLIGASSLLDIARLPGDTVHVLRGQRRGGVVQLPAGWNSILLTFNTSLELSSNEGSWPLPPQQLQFWQDTALELYNRTVGGWLVVSAPAELWREISHNVPGSQRLFPVEQPRHRAMTRAMIRLARRRWCPSGDSPCVDILMRQLAGCANESQHALQAFISRCSGRTHERRQQTLLRLLRVQNLIRCRIDNRIDLKRLAASANYSQYHLIRVYSEVFGETPGEFAARLRRERAWHLVCHTGMAICEISEALGFISESAFCRAFKESYGQTTSQARKRPALGHFADLPS